MTTPTSGPISLLDIQNEFGGQTPISLNEYYSMAAGLPANGAISINSFYNKQFLVVETITSSGTWTPKLNKATNIHIFAIGAGGSGGHGWPARNVGAFGSTDGVAGASGGSAGGTSYSIIAAANAATSNVVIGTGGAGVRVTSEDNATAGRAGTLTSFTGSGLTMVANGGKAGGASRSLGGSGAFTSGPAVTGGTASGGNVANFTGGSSGSYSCAANVNQGAGIYTWSSASGGGAVRFDDSNLSNSPSANNSVRASAGAKVSNYSTVPAILSTYISGRSQTPVLSGSITSFDGSNATVTSGGTATPTYGSGSGASGAEASSFTGNGGNGVVIIVYEI